MSQPFGVSCRGGLNTNLNQFEMLRQPGLAIKLKNFEVDPDGGYRRINGFTPFGDTRPETNQKILGLFPYALGIVAVVNESIYYSEDGSTWIKVNYDTGHAGVTEANLSSQTLLPRTSQGQAQFALFKASTGHTSNEYGSLSIATGADAVAHFHIDGTGASRLFVYEELSTPTAGTYLEIHDKHLCVVDTVNAPSTVYYSDTNNDRAFTAGTAGAVSIADRIVGIKSFRDSLYIFCANTIHRLDNINDAATLQVVQITNNVGCLSGYSIQEIGGDVVFLSPDGIRTIAGTARIGDVELGSVSRQIQQIISDISNNIDEYTISSAILRSKSQYRLFYTDTTSPTYETSKGIIGTLTPNGFEWSETEGIQALGLVSNFNSNNIEVSYHGDKDGYIYNHDTGNQFNPAGVAANIPAIYETPNFDFGDIGTRKTLKYVRVSFSPEGTCEPYLKVSYDFEDPAIPQPNLYYFDVPIPSVFGTALFNSGIFGATNDPMARQTVEGSGNTISFRIGSDDQRAPYAINGLYVDYMPSGRR